MYLLYRLCESGKIKIIALSKWLAFSNDTDGDGEPSVNVGDK